MFNEKPIISKWVADMYDQKVTETNDVDFLLSVIGQTPKRILEVCCGSGRILVPLAKAGHQVSGFDYDEFMLAKIPAKAEELQNIAWQKSDAIQDDWGTGFDVVVLAGNILYNIVSDMDYTKSQELLIQKAASALVPGGYVYIEYQPGGHRIAQSTPSHDNNDGEWVVWEGTDNDGNSGKMSLTSGSYDAATGMSSFMRRFELTLKNGEKITQDIQCGKHFAPLEQLRGWLRGAGFIIEQEYSDFKGNPVNDDSRGIVIYARKKEQIEYKNIDERIYEKIVGTYGDWIKKYIKLDANAFALSAMDGDFPAGFICVTPRTLTYPLEHIQDAFIEVLEVDEQYQRQGIGRYLVERGEEWAVKNGFQQIRTHSNDKAANAIKLWNKLNYGLCPHVFYAEEGCKGYWVAKPLKND